MSIADIQAKRAALPNPEHVREAHLALGRYTADPVAVAKTPAGSTTSTTSTIPADGTAGS